ncbi:MAG: N-acetyltransferase [Dehalococcoidia bacterium]
MTDIAAPTSDEPGLPSRITVREIGIDDLPGVYRLGKRLFTKARVPALYRTWEPYEVTYYYNTDSDYCIVAETQSKELAGFALGTTVEKDGGAWRYGYLAWLGVAPEYQRQAVAAALLKEFERRMREEGVRMLIVDTEGNNTPALNFFDRHGFKQPTTHVWLTKNLRKPANRSPKPAVQGETKKRRALRKPTIKPVVKPGVG